jgi:hypothetical protein
MAWWHRLTDRVALIVCALVVDAALLWLVFHPSAAVVLQVSLIAGVTMWRVRLEHRFEALTHV